MAVYHFSSSACSWNNFQYSLALCQIQEDGGETEGSRVKGAGSKEGLKIGNLLIYFIVGKNKNGMAPSMIKQFQQVGGGLSKLQVAVADLGQESGSPLILG